MKGAYSPFGAETLFLYLSETVQIITPITGVPAKLTARISLGAVAVGAKVQVTVQVQDSLNQTVTSANNQVIRVIPNSPTAVVPGSGVTEGGVTTFTVSDRKAVVVNLSVVGRSSV